MASQTKNMLDETLLVLYVFQKEKIFRLTRDRAHSSGWELVGCIAAPVMNAERLLHTQTGQKEAVELYLWSARGGNGKRPVPTSAAVTALADTIVDAGVQARKAKPA